MADTIEEIPTITIKSSLAKPKIKHSVKVKGKTLDELRKNLNKLKFWGRYTVNATANYKNNGAKLITEVSVSAKPQIEMPNWSDYAKAKKEEQSAWDDMYAVLLKHEMNHHALALEVFAIYLTEISDKVKEIAAHNKAVAKETDEKKRQKLIDTFIPLKVDAIKKRLKTLATDLQAVQDDYDSKTDHGKKEGVTI